MLSLLLRRENKRRDRVYAKGVRIDACMRKLMRGL